MVEVGTDTGEVIKLTSDPRRPFKPLWSFIRYKHSLNGWTWTWYYPYFRVHRNSDKKTLEFFWKIL